MAACEALACRLPGGWPNVLSMHIKTQKSPSVPLYMSFGSRNAIRLPKPQKPDDDVEGDLTTIPGAHETLGDRRLRRLLEIQEKSAEETTRKFDKKARCRKLLIQSTLRNKKSRKNRRLKAAKLPAPQKKATKDQEASHETEKKGCQAEVTKQ
ncbi:hypothetical protein MTO96_022689 [Rhipicephalus appendiculatus]